MKKSIIALFALSALVSCQSLKEEFQPVFTSFYHYPPFYETDSLTVTHTIGQLVALYTPETPLTIKEDVVISGVVSTTDQPGNFYKSFFIQDETGGIEIKVGKNSLYNDYQPGQRIYVNCKDLTLGMYGYKTGNYGGMGMAQIGFSDPSGTYETSYIESQMIINEHIFRGRQGFPVVPVLINSPDLLPDPKTATQATNHLVGKLVTLKGLKYAKENFVLLYLDSTKDKKAYSNRVFLSDSNGNDKFNDNAHGITTWAMSETKMKEHLLAGDWDGAFVGSGNTFLFDDAGNKVSLGDLKGEDGTYPTVEKAAYSVSQYFTLGGTEIQIRTSGFCKFCDVEIDPDVLSGAKTITVTGILSLYQGSIQITVNSLDDFVVDE
ncbi:MAG: hypothetical protein J5748_06200 [Bacteroidales bacterium]|nr:hypothetical protein [Bacteroidales bacterium]